MLEFAARVRELLGYDPETGVLSWRYSRRGVRAGPAGSVNKNGYVNIQIDGRIYAAHRIAWLWVHGEWPTGQLDHHFGNRADNRIHLLRPATQTQNNANCPARKTSRIGLKGVKFSKEPGRRARYAARITASGKTHHLGWFHTAEEAHAAYASKAVELFGEFARAA